MARKTFGPLDTGDTFPDLHFSLADGGEIATAKDLAGFWSVILVYRGSW